MPRVVKIKLFIAEYVNMKSGFEIDESPYTENSRSMVAMTS